MMKKVFLDTNVLIDYLARRGQFFQPAAQIVQLGQDRQCDFQILRMPCSTTLPSAREPKPSSPATAKTLMPRR